MRGIRVIGNELTNPDNSPGTVYSYNGNTSELDGTFSIPNAVVPAYWDHQVQEPIWCANAAAPPIQDWGIIDYYHVYALVDFYTPNNWWCEWTCNVPPGTIPPASSRFAIAGSIPSSVTLNGLQPFSTTYGMPVLDVYNGTNGNVNHVTTITASSVDPNGAFATFSLPSDLAASAYAFTTSNVTESSGFTPNSLNLYSVAGSQTISGNPFGVAVNAQTETIQTCKWYPGPYLWCGPETSSYSTAPVISLYSQNQVLIGSTTVTVGANPTAVATYNGGVVHRGWSPNTDDFTGTTRAIVADSGTNLVSIA